MQYLNTRKAIGLILALAFFIGGTHTALAVGTASGLTISNTATVDYDVSGDSRSASSVAVDFLVDNKVDLTVTNQDGNNVNVTPGSTNQVLTFTVTNTGNTTQGYLLTTAIPTANIPMTFPVTYIYIEDGTTPGFQITEDTAYTVGDNAFNLDPNGVIGTDDVRTVYVIANTPAGAVDSNQDDVRLVATTTASGVVGNPAVALAESGAPTAGVDVVFADGSGTTSDAANNGDHSDFATYTVVSAALTAAKAVAGVVDDFNAYPNGFNIPGAVVRYQITISNTGAGAVDNNTVVVSDPIPADTKVCVSAVDLCVAADVFSCSDAATSLTCPVAPQYSNDGGTTWAFGPTADGDGADTAVTHVRFVPTGTMASGDSLTITFGVVIE